MTRRMFTDQLDRAFDGDSWHGGATWPLLQDLSADEAADHPLPDVHSVWELVLHMIGWTREVTRRLKGGEPTLPEEGDWPAVEQVTEERWEEARHGSRRAHDELIAALEVMPDDRLDAPVGRSREPELGTGFTHAGMIAGLIEHNAYHSGQIAIIRKQLLSRRRRATPSPPDPTPFHG